MLGRSEADLKEIVPFFEGTQFLVNEKSAIAFLKEKDKAKLSKFQSNDTLSGFSTHHSDILDIHEIEMEFRAKARIAYDEVHAPTSSGNAFKKKRIVPTKPYASNNVLSRFFIYT